MTANQDIFLLMDGYCSLCILLVTWALLIICCLFILTKNSLDISKHCIFSTFSYIQTTKPSILTIRFLSLTFSQKAKRLGNRFLHKMILYIFKLNKALAEVSKVAICQQYKANPNVHYLSLFESVHCLSSFLSALPLNCAACLG